MQCGIHGKKVSSSEDEDLSHTTTAAAAAPGVCCPPSNESVHFLLQSDTWQIFLVFALGRAERSNKKAAATVRPQVRIQSPSQSAHSLTLLQYSGTQLGCVTKAPKKSF